VGKTSSWKRVAINAFLIFHIAAIACWCLPFNNPLTGAVRGLVRPYFLWSGLFQSWDMFSPTPKLANSYMEAIVLYQDGETRIWAFPRMEQLSIPNRYAKERYRKFVEVLEDDKSAAFWPDAARFIAKKNNNRAVPVKTVLLVRYWSFLTPQPDGSFTSMPWDEHVFYAYNVTAEDLK
jgi:hypothetical protein